MKSFVTENEMFVSVIEWVKNITASGEVFTHSGKFHADEVFASAYLRIFGFEGKIIRVNEAPENTNSLVYDIGGGQFDHHQENKARRKDGIPYAAFGLICKASGIFNILPEFEKFVKPLDAADNGEGRPTEIGRLIVEANPSFYNYNSKAFDEAFEKAVYLAEEILLNKLRILVDEDLATEKLRILVDKGSFVETADGSGIVVIADDNIPLTNKVCQGYKTPIAGIVCPSERDKGCYYTLCRRGYSISNLLYENRNRIDGIGFIHAIKFVAVSYDKDTAIKIAETNVVSRDKEENVSIDAFLIKEAS